MRHPNAPFNMIKVKTLPKVSQLVTWANNHSIEVLGFLREPEGVSMIYRQPDKTHDGEPERVKILAKRLKRHFDYPDTVKTGMNYPEGIIGFRVVPLTRLVNSIRNLTAFKDMSPKELAGWVEASLPAVNCKLVRRSEAKIEFSTDATLIEELL